MPRILAELYVDQPKSKKKAVTPAKQQDKRTMYEKALEGAANFNLEMQNQRAVIKFETRDDRRRMLKKRKTDGPRHFLGEFLACPYEPGELFYEAMNNVDMLKPGYVPPVKVVEAQELPKRPVDAEKKAVEAPVQEIMKPVKSPDNFVPLRQRIANKSTQKEQLKQEVTQPVQKSDDFVPLRQRIANKTCQFISTLPPIADTQVKEEAKTTQPTLMQKDDNQDPAMLAYKKIQQIKDMLLQKSQAPQMKVQPTFQPRQGQRTLQQDSLVQKGEQCNISKLTLRRLVLDGHDSPLYRCSQCAFSKIAARFVIYKGICKQCAYSSDRKPHEYAVAWTCGQDFYEQRGFKILQSGSILLNDGTMIQANLTKPATQPVQQAPSVEQLRPTARQEPYKAESPQPMDESTFLSVPTAKSLDHDSVPKGKPMPQQSQISVAAPYPVVENQQEKNPYAINAPEMTPELEERSEKRAEQAKEERKDSKSAIYEALEQIQQQQKDLELKTKLQQEQQRKMQEILQQNMMKQQLSYAQQQRNVQANAVAAMTALQLLQQQQAAVGVQPQTPWQMQMWQQQQQFMLFQQQQIQNALLGSQPQINNNKFNP